jgi:hypothetical protein
MLWGEAGTEDPKSGELQSRTAGAEGTDLHRRSARLGGAAKAARLQFLTAMGETLRQPANRTHRVIRAARFGESRHFIIGRVAENQILFTERTVSTIAILP